MKDVRKKKKKKNGKISVNIGVSQKRYGYTKSRLNFRGAFRMFGNNNDGRRCRQDRSAAVILVMLYPSGDPSAIRDFSLFRTNLIFKPDAH